MSPPFPSRLRQAALGGELFTVYKKHSLFGSEDHARQTASMKRKDEKRWAVGLVVSSIDMYRFTINETNP